MDEVTLSHAVSRGVVGYTPAAVVAETRELRARYYQLERDSALESTMAEAPRADDAEGADEWDGPLPEDDKYTAAMKSSHMGEQSPTSRRQFLKEASQTFVFQEGVEPHDPLVLLLSRQSAAPGCPELVYFIPGGKREPTDPGPLHTAVRENLEEVNLAVEPARYALAQTITDDRPLARWAMHDYAVVITSAEASALVNREPDKHLEMTWKSVSAIRALPLDQQFDRLAERCDHALRFTRFQSSSLTTDPPTIEDVTEFNPSDLDPGAKPWYPVTGFAFVDGNAVVELSPADGDLDNPDTPLVNMTHVDRD